MDVASKDSVAKATREFLKDDDGTLAARLEGACEEHIHGVWLEIAHDLYEGRAPSVDRLRRYEEIQKTAHATAAERLRTKT